MMHFVAMPEKIDLHFSHLCSRGSKNLAPGNTAPLQTFCHAGRGLISFWVMI